MRMGRGFLVGALQNGLDPYSAIDMLRENQAQRQAEQAAEADQQMQFAMMMQEQEAAQAAAQQEAFGGFAEQARDAAMEGVPFDDLRGQIAASARGEGLRPRQVMRGLAPTLNDLYIMQDQNPEGGFNNVGYSRVATEMPLDAADTAAVIEIIRDSLKEGLNPQEEAHKFAAKSYGPQVYGRLQGFIQELVEKYGS